MRGLAMNLTMGLMRTHALRLVTALLLALTVGCEIETEPLVVDATPKCGLHDKACCEPDADGGGLCEPGLVCEWDGRWECNPDLCDSDYESCVDEAN